MLWCLLPGLTDGAGHGHVQYGHRQLLFEEQGDAKHLHRHAPHLRRAEQQQGETWSASSGLLQNRVGGLPTSRTSACCCLYWDRSTALWAEVTSL